MVAVELSLHAEAAVERLGRRVVGLDLQRNGARAAGLQVQADNASAQALYRRLGLGRELYRYHYRRGP